ncbi:MAG TPA: hypothetical protein VFD27_00460, partial [Chthoniobacteraceae bacterium]|nr:hypothetical protein [Chthoniobacteraceae bacterium]
MTTPLLKLALAPIVERRRQVRLLWRLAACWGVGAALAFAGAFSSPLPLIFLVTLAAYIVWKVSARWEPDYREIARLVERQHPELHALLLTAVEQQPDRKSGELHFLQKRVIQDAIVESRKHSWIDAVPTSRWVGVAVLQFLLLFALAFSLARMPRGSQSTNQPGALAKDAVEVTPGDTSIERGSGLVVLAKFGPQVPSEAMLVLQPLNAAAQRIALVKNLDDPIFGGGVPEVDGDLTYHIEYAGKSTPDYRVTVFEHPRLERADATIRYPEYTHLPEKQIPDTRRVTAVEGSQLAVEFQLNKPVKSAKLVGKDQSIVPLEVDSQKAVATLKNFPLKNGQTYELKLEDSDGRANKLSSQLVVNVQANRRPDLKFKAPKGDQSVTALQEVSFKAEAWDDFGMPAYGLNYTVAGQEPEEVIVGHDSKPDEHLMMEHLLQLEKLSVEQDQLVSWYLWADDFGPDGKVRRTASDMFFAEVRPFEEIFRPGHEGAGQQGQQQQGQSPQGEQAQKLAEMQKQIITATWNLKRAEDAHGTGQPSDKYLKDEPVVRDSQQDALSQATELQERIEDPKSQALVEDVTKAMKTAFDHLAEAAQSLAPLPSALGAEQSAYNALLKL